jgi:hypothetical protein
VHLRTDQPLMGADQDGRDTPLCQKHQQFVQLNRQESFFGRRVQLTIQAVDHDHLGALFDNPTNRVGEFPLRQLGRIHLLH